MTKLAAHAWDMLCAVLEKRMLLLKLSIGMKTRMNNLFTFQNLPPLFLITASVNALYVWIHPLVDISPSVAPPSIVPPDPM